jgi:hypothetical protein
VSAPHVGDRVRATLGDSVVIGTLLDASGLSIKVKADGASREMALDGRWAFEKVESPYTDPELHPGMVLRDADSQCAGMWLYAPEDGCDPYPFHQLGPVSGWYDRCHLPARIVPGYIGADGRFVPLDTP